MILWLSDPVSRKVTGSNMSAKAHSRLWALVLEWRWPVLRSALSR